MYGLSAKERLAAFQKKGEDSSPRRKSSTGAPKKVGKLNIGGAAKKDTSPEKKDKKEPPKKPEPKEVKKEEQGPKKDIKSTEKKAVADKKPTETKTPEKKADDKKPVDKKVDKKPETKPEEKKAPGKKEEDKPDGNNMSRKGSAGFLEDAKSMLKKRGSKEVEAKPGFLKDAKSMLRKSSADKGKPAPKPPPKKDAKKGTGAITEEKTVTLSVDTEMEDLSGEVEANKALAAGMVSPVVDTGKDKKGPLAGKKVEPPKKVEPQKTEVKKDTPEKKPEPGKKTPEVKRKEPAPKDAPKKDAPAKKPEPAPKKEEPKAAAPGKTAPTKPVAEKDAKGGAAGKPAPAPAAKPGQTPPTAGETAQPAAGGAKTGQASPAGGQAAAPAAAGAKPGQAAAPAAGQAAKPGQAAAPAAGQAAKPGQAAAPAAGQAAKPGQAAGQAAKPGQAAPAAGQAAKPGQAPPAAGQAAKPGQAAAPAAGQAAKPGQAAPAAGQAAKPGQAAAPAAGQAAKPGQAAIPAAKPGQAAAPAAGQAAKPGQAAAPAAGQAAKPGQAAAPAAGQAAKPGHAAVPAAGQAAKPGQAAAPAAGQAAKPGQAAAPAAGQAAKPGQAAAPAAGQAAAPAKPTQPAAGQVAKPAQPAGQAATPSAAQAAGQAPQPTPAQGQAVPAGGQAAPTPKKEPPPPKKEYTESQQLFIPAPDEFYNTLFYFSGMGSVIGDASRSGVYVSKSTSKRGLDAEFLEEEDNKRRRSTSRQRDLVNSARTQATDLTSELRKLQQLLESLPTFGEGVDVTQLQQQAMPAPAPGGGDAGQPGMPQSMQIGSGMQVQQVMAAQAGPPGSPARIASPAGNVQMTVISQDAPDARLGIHSPIPTKPYVEVPQAQELIMTAQQSSVDQIAQAETDAAVVITPAMERQAAAEYAAMQQAAEGKFNPQVQAVLPVRACPTPPPSPMGRASPMQHQRNTQSPRMQAYSPQPAQNAYQTPLYAQPKPIQVLPALPKMVGEEESRKSPVPWGHTSPQMVQPAFASYAQQPPGQQNHVPAQPAFATPAQQPPSQQEQGARQPAFVAYMQQPPSQPDQGAMRSRSQPPNMGVSSPEPGSHAPRSGAFQPVERTGTPTHPNVGVFDPERARRTGSQPPSVSGREIGVHTGQIHLGGLDNRPWQDRFGTTGVQNYKNPKPFGSGGLLDDEDLKPWQRSKIRAAEVHTVYQPQKPNPRVYSPAPQGRTSMQAIDPDIKSYTPFLTSKKTQQDYMSKLYDRSERSFSPVPKGPSKPASLPTNPQFRPVSAYSDL